MSTRVSLFLISSACLALPAIAQQSVALAPVTPDQFNGDVRNIKYVSVRAPGVQRKMLDEHEPPPSRKPRRTGQATPNVERAPMPGTIVNFAGLTNKDGGLSYPSDVNGDVGPNHYIESINDAYAIYSKTGTRLALFTEDALWQGVGSSPCNGNSQGDPVVLYDRFADRWFLTHFAFGSDTKNNDIPPFYECIAVSKNGDPVNGGWWLYAIRTDPGGTGLPPVGSLTDYPKFGIWSDGCLYMAGNVYNESTSPSKFAGTIAMSFSRADMESGGTVRPGAVYLTNTTDPFTMIPANLLGTALPAGGTPAYFVSESQTDYFWDVRKYTPGANCGAGGSLSAPVHVNQTSYTVPGGSIVTQPNTIGLLDSLSDRLMQKVQYRKVGNNESLWVVHSVQTSNNSPVALQWAQINVTGGNISTNPVQQQIFAPDSVNRWVGSLAVDQQGNMAVGYSTSNGAVPNYPSIKYAGRLVNDPLNSLSQTEVTMMAGAASQTHVISGDIVDRWGDYSSMSIDPVDDCTFWYINQYYANQTDGNGGNWSTRIGSFKFPGCGGSQPVSSAPTPTSTAPAFGNLSAQTFVFTFDAPGGYQTLKVADVLINSALDGRRACYVAIVPSGANGGSVLLVNDAGDAGGPYQGLVVPGGGSINNGQCSISGAASSISGSGNTVTVKLGIAFSSGFTGNKVIYTAAKDTSDRSSPWRAQGVWYVPGGSPTTLWVAGASPGRSTSASATYAFGFQDFNGLGDLAVANVLINDGIDGRHACFLAFVPSGPSSGTVYLVNDAGDAGGPYQALTVPSNGSVSNSQCTINGSGSAVSTSGGNSLLLTLPITLSHAFAGDRVVYLAARSNTQTSGWQSVGTATVP
jgi:hypothetical protein